jgi:hypothetical protein
MSGSPASCPSCGAPLHANATICTKCGTTVATGAAGSNSRASGGGTPGRSRALLVTAVIVVAIVVVVAGLYALGAFKGHAGPGHGSGHGSGGGGTGPTEGRDVVDHSAPATLGPGTNNAVSVPFTVTAAENDAQLVGFVNVTTCAADGNCSAFAYVMSTSNWTNFTAGTPFTPIWCVSIGGECYPGQQSFVEATTLSSYAGQNLLFVVYNPDTTESIVFETWVYLAYEQNATSS